LIRFGILSDGHQGSNEAPSHPSIHEPNNPLAEELNHILFDKIIPQTGKLDALHCNGDMIDGTNYKGRGLGIWDTDIVRQVDSAEAILREFDMKKKAKMTFIEGSGYHTGNNPSGDNMLSKRFPGSTYDIDMAISFEKCRNKKDGRPFRGYFRHKVGTSKSESNRGGVLSRELAESLLTEEHYGRFDGLFFSHVHHFDTYYRRGRMVMTTPGLKTRDLFVKGLSLSWVPDIGMVVLEIPNTWERARDIHVEYWSYIPDKKNLIHEVIV